MEKQIRYLHIEYLRTFTILSVFLGHALRIYFSGGWYFHKAEINLFCDILDKIIYSFHMPLFVFLSGYLFYSHKNKIKNALNYLKKRAKRLLLPFFIAGFFYVLPMIILINPLEKTPLFYYQNFLNLKFCWHLWFLPMLYLVTMIFVFIFFKLKSFDKRLLILVLVILNLVKISGSQICICTVPKFLIYFYLGYLIIEYKDLFLKFVTKYFFIILMLLFLFEALLYNCPKVTLISLITAMLAIIILYYVSLKISAKTKKINLLISFLSKNMFALYILHEPIMAMLLRYMNWGNKFPPSITSIILFLGTLFICIVIIGIYLFLRQKIISRKVNF